MQADMSTLFLTPYDNRGDTPLSTQLQKWAVYEILGKLQNSLQFWDGERIKPSILSFGHSLAGI